MPTALKPDEKRFIKRYVDLGAVVEHIHEAERKARVRVGTGAKMLKLVRVKAEIDRLMAPIRAEQERQRIVSEGAGRLQAKAEALEAQLAETKAELAVVTSMPLMTVDEGVLEHELMRIVCLDPEKYGTVKLAAIHSAAALKGLMKMRTMERMVPAEKVVDASTSVYSSLFDRLREGAEDQPVNVTPQPDAPMDGVFDLVPQPPKPKEAVSVATVMSREGEAIAVEAAVVAKARSRSGRAVATQVISLAVG